ncbi:MAG TPA: TIGR03435 family protein [Terriglobia bacterium]|jgi:uncharacterized protein (TIGR03435 family)
MKYALIISFIAFATALSGRQVGFEAATVKPAATNDPQSGVMRDSSPGRITYRNMTLRDLLYQAYGTGLSTAMNVSGGPAWIARDRFTIEAVAQGNPDDRQFRLMLRKLLEERFAVQTRWETRQIDVYALVLDRDGKPGSKLKTWDGTCAGGRPPRDYDDPAMPRCPGASFHPSGLILEGATMVPLAEMLSTQRRLLGRIVQDRTGLTGRYNIDLQFDFINANQPDAPGPSIFTALKEQLDLKLEAAKGPLDVLVVENASPPTEN